MKLKLEIAHRQNPEFELSLKADVSGLMVGIFGPSGAGKTTVLDVIAGLRRVDTARVQLGDRVLTDTQRGLFVPVRRRRIGYVPQDGALFPHLDVRRNLLFGVKKGELSEDGLFSFDHVTGVLDIARLLDRSVPRLSGGEKQRVAIARALLSSPDQLLFDEPLGSLDQTLKDRIIPYLRRVRDEFRVPMLYVTHSPDEVVALCDEVLILRRGQLDGQGVPSDYFSRAEASGYVLKREWRERWE